MTEGQVRAKTLELIDESAKHMRANIEKVLTSGAVDITEYNDTYLLPKINLSALLREEQWQYRLPQTYKNEARLIDNIFNTI